MPINVVQCSRSGGKRIVAIVDENKLRVVGPSTALYEFAHHAITTGKSLEAVIREGVTESYLDYDNVYYGRSEWKLLPPFDHPIDPAHCLVTGTGLSHLKSAANRNAMHASGAENAPLTDSMQMYQMGEAGGRPPVGEIGSSPEWFWKGDGAILRGHGIPLTVPNYAEDGGDEAEIAGIYIVAESGDICRVGLAAANEFSDHVMESRNYLFLAPSKLRQCAIGPEIVIGGTFDNIAGEASVRRGDEVVWSQNIATGESNMVHSLTNLEHHHFKYAQHRRAGDVHIHCFGTPGFSFGSGLKLQDGDVMSVRFDGFGRALRNPIRIDQTTQHQIGVRQL